MNFDFVTARILFGRGALKQAGELLPTYGRRAFILTGRDRQRAQPLLNLLQAQGIVYETLAVPGEPPVELVDEGARRARSFQADFVAAFGGGSVLDAGKVIAALLTNPGETLDYLEVVGRGRAVALPAAPFAAIPTTAGTGSEVTRNAVIGVIKQNVKVSMRSPHLMPRLAVVDPDLTLSCPPDVTAQSGLDALTQLIEAYVNPKANPLTDGFCREGIRRAARSLAAAVREGANVAAREDMALASLLGGMALANAGLGAVHGFSSPLGGMFPVPHGAACACLLAPVTAMNLRVLRARQPAASALQRYADIARWLTGDPQAGADAAVAWLRQTTVAVGIPELASFGVRRDAIPLVVERTLQANSTRGNPAQLAAEDLTEILEEALAKD